MAETAQNSVIMERMEEALREIGVLLIVLAPLDAIVTTNRQTVVGLLLFSAGGLILFGVAIWLERSRKRG